MFYFCAMITEIGRDMHKAAELLRSDAVVAIPTETVYGLAGNGLSQDAILAIYEAKNRPLFDPLILHFCDIASIKPYILSFHPLLQKLAAALMPGPLTLLLPRSEKVPDLITSGMDRVAVRIPNHSLAQSLLRAVDFPLAAPSANPFGYISPTNAAHVYAQLHGKIPYILDGGETSVGLESTIVGEENGEIIIYRLGGTTIDAIENCIGKVTVNTNKSSNPKAPGMLKSHYSPRKPLTLFSDFSMLDKLLRTTAKNAVMTFSENYAAENTDCYLLSAAGSDKEAAKNLFATLRKMDESDATDLYAQLLPEEGMGIAINDRLTRAAARD